MKSTIIIFRYFLILIISITLTVQMAEAQRFQHSRPERSSSRPAGGGFENRSINGGSIKSSSQRPAEWNDRSRNVEPSRQAGGNNRVSTGDRNINSGNRNNVGNKVTVDNSRKNVNVNVDNSKNINVNNSRNTVVRSNNYRPYPRPPYVYGGHRYYCFHPYFYHPYHPFYWGPVWHPWGFFVATIATTAIIVSVENQHYYYDQGVYYIQSNGGYTVVQAPVGATVKTLPDNTQTVVVNETTNNYYYGGTYYEKSKDGYTVVPPTAGTVVENLPEGGEEVKIGDVTYVKYGETYYQPIQQDGKNMYEVVQIEDDNK